MIEPSEALKIILDSAERLEAKSVPVDQSVGFVLDEDITSLDDIPPFDNSAMDGFAILAEDTIGATKDNPARLKIIDDQPAGKVSDKEVEKGTAIKVMTGAPIPKGTNTVVPIEDTEYDDEEVNILVESKKDRHIRLAGEDIRSGSTVLSTGKVIDPVEVGVMASVGKSDIKVIRKPKVAVIGTGDEIVPLGEPLTPGKIRDSNSYVIYNQALCCGAISHRIGIAKDTLEDVREKLLVALQHDVIITTGGVSVGERDFVKDVMEELGAEHKFWKVAQKPGKPLVFMTVGQKLFFGLPGNPVAAVVSFEEYVRPALLKMMGRKKLFRPLVNAVASEDLKKKPGRTHFVGVMVDKKDGDYHVRLNGRQGSGILTSMAGAEGIAILPKESGLIEKGQLIEVQLIDQPEDH